MDTSQFDLSGYGQNLAATITVAIIFGVGWLVRNKCKHSRCAINSKCVQCSADDFDTVREDPRPPVVRRVESREEGEIQMV